MIFLTYIFVLLAAFFNAFMDIVENENYHVSIFKNLNQKFWYKRESWKQSYKIRGYKLDAWHLAKSLMIVFWVLAVMFYHSFIPVIDFIVIGAIYNLTFNTFYRLFKL